MKRGKFDYLTTSYRVSSGVVLTNSEVNLDIHKFVPFLSVIVENEVVMAFG